MRIAAAKSDAKWLSASRSFTGAQDIEIDGLVQVCGTAT